MSQIEPYYDYSQMPPDDNDFEPTQMRGGSSWQGGWRPPSQQPGCGPSWPGPGPGGGGWPFWGYWGFRLRSAWRDVKFLQKLIHDIVNEMIDNGIVAPGPNYVPGPGSTVPSPTGTKGVTDGSDAGPGMVGEFITGQAAFTFSATASTQTTVSPLVVQPGDWDLWSTMNLPVPVAAASYNLSPVPAGMSNPMQGANVSTGAEAMWMIGRSARGSFSVPTLLAFAVFVDPQTGGAGGTGTLIIEARRRR